jgi:hypothetical protein
MSLWPAVKHFLRARTQSVVKSDSGVRILSITSYGARSGVFVLANQFEDQPAENGKVIFEQVGESHFLSKIQTLDGVYIISVPRSSVLVAGVKQHQSMSASGTN